MLQTKENRKHTPAVVPYATRSGVMVGSRWAPPMPSPSRDAEILQAALLAKPKTFAQKLFEKVA